MPADRDRGQPPATDPRLDRRTRVAQASQPVLQRLTGVPTFVIAALVGVGVLAALLVDNRWAALGVLPALALLGWLSYLAWPHLAPSQRVLRVGVLVVLIVWAATRLLG
ncbi:MAG TPA: DUF6703 family protein [Nocardioidaceae bacterium]|nr:DUF6703 family protein [Nocardioidaceae bacterium]